MIAVTPEAAGRILESARQAGFEGQPLRLAARLDAQGTIEYGLGFDEAGEGDIKVTSGGVTILVAAGSAELLAGATLDFVEINPGEKRFIFINPNDPSHKAPKAG